MKTLNKLTKKDTKGNCMTYSGIIKLRNQLVLENDPTNDELIAFYNKKLSEVLYNVINTSKL